MEKIRIHDLDGNGLAFDLRHVLRALAPRSLGAKWMITSSIESYFEATGEGGLRLEQLAEERVQIIGSELLSIADNTWQVIWGDFIGFLHEAPDTEWLIIRAVDSSFFEIETSDQICTAAIKSHFHDVRVG